MRFRPKEILFAPTARCNLACAHCNVRRTGKRLSAGAAKRFLAGAKKVGIKRIGFTGGEPFLAPDFLCSVAKFGVQKGFLFSVITTNAVWFRTGAKLEKTLTSLFEAGYDGSFVVSVDAYHRQDLRKVASFVRTAAGIWGRPDIASVVYVTGRQAETERKLRKLMKLVPGCFVKTAKIELSPVGRASRLKDPWDGRWFKEDYCKGPGNVFMVEPSGDVKPCCGYASDRDELKIGNIRKDTAAGLLKNFNHNKKVCGIFSLGLSRIRKNLSKAGVKFPGKTSNNCYFCYHILMRKLIMAILVTLACSSLAFAADDKDNYGYYPSAGPGMQVKKVNNDVSVMMPADAKFHRRNQSTYIAETGEEYYARKFAELAARVDKLETENAEMKREVSALRDKLNEAKNTAPEVPAE